jgi:hypothetical protein
MNLSFIAFTTYIHRTVTHSTVTSGSKTYVVPVTKTNTITRTETYCESSTTPVVPVPTPVKNETHVTSTYTYVTTSCPGKKSKHPLSRRTFY